MRLAIIIGCLALAITGAVSISVSERLHQIDKNEFGRRLLDIIQVQMNTNAAPLQPILDILEGLRKSLQADLQGVENVFETSKKECFRTLKSLKKEINRNKRKSVKAQTRIDAKKLEIQNVQLQLDEQLKVQAAVQTRVQQLQESRDAERTKFEEAVTDLSRLREALKKAKAILSKVNKGDTSYVELQAHMDSLELETNYMKGIHKMARAFLQTASRGVDAKQLQHLFGVIDRIIQQLHETEYALTSTEMEKETLFQIEFNEVSTLLNSASAKLNGLIGEKQEIEATIVRLTNDISNYKRTVQQRTQERGHKRKQCKNQGQQYRDQTKKLDEQLALLDEIIRLLKEGVEPVQDYVDKRDPDEKEDGNGSGPEGGSGSAGGNDLDPEDQDPMGGSAGNLGGGLGGGDAAGGAGGAAGAGGADGAEGGSGSTGGSDSGSGAGAGSSGSEGGSGEGGSEGGEGGASGAEGGKTCTCDKCNNS
eukprot:TRINITY_DN202_c0_g1_i1.p1 TRINITY_DN202_c0_g1~~TRINITY_DN202_c0_g1_i1.p1  ORF type:complete len:479 (+),score=176.97 TRINITY_DN202_c0_g1_i1:110-1546(+)